MAAIKSLRTALQILVRTPVLFLAGLFLALVLLPQTVLSLAGVPIVPMLLQILTFFITPFILAGLIGMAAEGLDGDTSLSTWKRVGRDRYLPLLLGSLVEFGIAILFGIAFLVAIVGIVFAIGVGSIASGGFDPSSLGTGTLLIGIAVVGLLLLAYLVVAFFIQFYQVAIVADEADVVDGFRDSIGLVRNNLLSTLGYSIITVVVSLLVSAPVVAFAAFAALGSPQPPTGGTPMPGAFAPTGFSLVTVAALSAITFALSTVLTTFKLTYATAFYRQHSRSRSIEERILQESP